MSKKEQSKLSVFKQVYLSEGDRLVEMMCGVIMVLVMIGYLRAFVMEEGDTAFQRTLILVPLGCIAAWGIIDGVMYVLINLIDRGKIYKLFLSVKSARDQKDVHSSIEDELGSTIIGSLKDEDKEKIYDEILKRVNYATVEKPQWVTRKDLLVVLFTFLAVFFAGFPLVVPFIILNDLFLAIRISHIIGLVMLFCIGYYWGIYASRSKIRSAIGLVILGAAIVLLTIVLGG